MTTNTWTPLIDPASQKLPGVTSKGEQTPKYGPSFMEVDWGGKIEANHTSECMLCEVDLGAHETHTCGSMLSEVDWGVHDSSLFLCLKHIDHDGETKDFFTQGLWGGPPQRNLFIPLMEYLKDSLDNGQTEDGFFNFKSIKEHKGSYSCPDPEYLGSSYNLLIEWEPGENTRHLEPTLWQISSIVENSKQWL